MMPVLKTPESNLTNGLICGKAPIAKAPLVEVLSSFPEGDDHDIGFESAPHDVSKFSHEREEKMQAAVLDTELSSKEFATTKGILSFPSWLLLLDI